jgi:hypothetical protein
MTRSRDSPLAGIALCTRIALLLLQSTLFLEDYLVPEEDSIRNAADRREESSIPLTLSQGIRAERGRKFSTYLKYDLRKGIPEILLIMTRNRHVLYSRFNMPCIRTAFE